MTQQIINTGNAANDGTGTPLRSAFEICNNNFTELYNVVLGSSGNITSNNISAAGNVLVGGDYVQIPTATADPADPVPGAMYYNTNTSGLRLYTGSVWVTI
jgi:hypothetical protein